MVVIKKSLEIRRRAASEMACTVTANKLLAVHTDVSDYVYPLLPIELPCGLCTSPILDCETPFANALFTRDPFIFLFATKHKSRRSKIPIDITCHAI